MMSRYNCIGLLGGTFDPIHNGHLHLAKEVKKRLPLNEIQFIPTHLPPHRNPPIASAKDRLAMIQLAINDKPGFKANDIELQRTTPSYTIDTLKILHQTKPSSNICFAFIMASDQFSRLNHWHEWQALLDYCHLIVANRPDFEDTPPQWMQNLLKIHETKDMDALITSPNGKILMLEISPLAISGSDIRNQLKNKHDISAQVPKTVSDYINQLHLYC